MSISIATEADAAALAALRTDVADHLTRTHGHGPWSSAVTEKGVLWGMRSGKVLMLRSRGKIIAALRLATKKPWAIDRSFFTPVRRPLYLVEMAVTPAKQRQGIGAQLLEQATTVAHDWPADAIWLDAYDSPAGAGPFYAKCGYREVGRVTYRGTPLIYFEMAL